MLLLIFPEHLLRRFLGRCGDSLFFLGRGRFRTWPRFVHLLHFWLRGNSLVSFSGKILVEDNQKVNPVTNGHNADDQIQPKNRVAPDIVGDELLKSARDLSKLIC